MTANETLLLSRHDVIRLLSLDDCMDAVDRAFAMAARDEIPKAGVLGFPATDGGFHIKVAALPGEAGYFAAKLNGNFFKNRERFNMPNIQGVIVLADVSNGRPLAVMDSIEITILRTGAATGVAARCLARKEAHVLTVCGCGNQGRVSLRALHRALGLTQVYLWDLDPAASHRMAEEMKREMGLPIEVVSSFAEATRRSDVIATCTPARRAFLGADDVRPGAFIAAVGADNEEKHEIEPALLARSRVVTDSTEQCAKIGDLHHAINHGSMRREDVYAELGEVLAGLRPGRKHDEDIFIFDSTGTALQDVAAAALVYERAVRQGRGTTFRFTD